MTEQKSPERKSRCGYVALIGAPNAGKSTLLNRLVGAKISIVSPKVQTTRARVLGIAVEGGPEEGGAQFIFVDTPGIFAPKRRLDRAMVAAAWTGAEDADLVILLVDAARGYDQDTRRIVERLKKANRKAILVLNKVDKVRPEKILPLTAKLAEEGIFDPVFMISSLNGSGVTDLRCHLAAALPEGPWLFPEDQLTDMPLRLLAAEVTREQVFLKLHQELPYASTVETEAWEEFKDGSVKITQTIYVERPSQKAIVLGEGGQQIKRIGAAARAEIERLLERRAHLFLFVKVREAWMEDKERYQAMGLDFTE